MSDVEHAVPAGKTRVTLRGSIGFAAPIQTLFAAMRPGGLREVSGEVEVDFKPDGRYRATGVIDDLRNEVWLEDTQTHQIVPGSRVTKLTPDGEKAAAAPVVFACCNLHMTFDRWISDANWIQEPFLPAGTPVRVYERGDWRGAAMIDGKQSWLGLDFGRKQETFDQFLSEVTVALGYPRLDLTPSMAASRWSYIDESDVKFALLWNADGLLQAVEAPPALQALLVCGAECAPSH